MASLPAPGLVRLPAPSVVCGLVASALCAALVGAGLAGAAARISPWVIPVAAVAVVATAAVLADLSWVVVGLFLLLPVGLQNVGPLEVVQVASLAVLGLVATVSVTTGRRWGVPLSVGVPLGAVLLIGALSTAGSLAPELSVRALLQLCIGAGLMMSVAASIDSVDHLRRLVWVLVVVGAGISIAASSSVDQVTSAYGGAAVSGRAEGVFTQPNELGAFTAAVLVLAVGLWVGSHTGVGTVIAFVSVVAVSSALLSSLSRGAWIGAVSGSVAVVVLVAHQAEMRRRLIGLGLALVMLAFAAPLLVDHPLTRVIGARIETILEGGANPHDARPEIYDEALRQVHEAPLLGHGPGTFVSRYADSVSTGRSGGAKHAHNIALTLSAEFGLLGLVAFAALATAVLGAGWMAVRSLRRQGLGREAALCAGAVGALVTVLGHGVVDYPLRNPTLFLLHWAVAGLVLGYARVALTQRPTPEESP